MRIALFQCAPLPLDVTANLERLRQQAHEAAARGANLLVCPEMFLSGYNIGAEQVASLAQAHDGQAAQQVGEIARSCGIAIVYGYPERGVDDRIFNSVQLIDAQGQALGNYRKTHLFGELDRQMFSAGAGEFPIIELNGWRLGLLICYDLEFPENTRRLALAGAELILVPTANMKPYDFIAQVTVRARAQENQCYVAYANYCDSEGDIHYCGQSSIAAPDGSVLAQAQESSEMLVVSLDRELMTSVRAHTPYLQDRRPELYGDLSKG
ncbi:carbon-nitrogen hydrolase family protein [Pseudomonas sp. R5(2019)]|uniref:carbon-nitrogen hydrolase family protein n=1 Tax=Pseudomonas sp. R5(2019) TaxID=2697566 RepID=UPI0014120912|nr:carbon-nitrogen hydrolase family protein [Pseudomonas sp. R5(2019)]NBA96345.1 carbon-nitrogen hydrolase [Pseudomonas sp. R5(2019)]